MDRSGRWSRVLVVIGLVAIVIGTLDPLEGSILILAGVAVEAFGAWLTSSRHRTLLYWSLALVAVGVATMFGFSAVGGFGGRTGRPMWWALVLLPYPIGWLMGIVGSIRRLRESWA